MLDTEAVLCSGFFFFSLAFLVWVVICHHANLREACSAIVRGGGSSVIASQCEVDENERILKDVSEEWRAERACGSQQSCFC